jgi:hypothetical protein
MALLSLSEMRLALRAADHALKEASLAASIFKEIGDAAKEPEARAQVCICNAHLGKVALSKSQFPSLGDTQGALRAAKAAYQAYSQLAPSPAQADGLAAASKALSAALLATGVPTSSLPQPRDTEKLMETKDWLGLVDDLGGVASPFHESALNIRSNKEAQNVSKSKAHGNATVSKGFDRTNFKWTDPTKDFSYAMIWEPCKNMPPAAKRGPATCLAQGARTAALPLYHSIKCPDPSVVKSDEPICVHINAYDCSTNYGASLMAALHTISAMAVANLRRVTFVQLGEAPPAEGCKDAPNQQAARQIAMSPCTLALIRTARIEVPQMSLGFVAGDAASWMNCRAEMVSAIFDTHNNDGEIELMWSRKQPMQPHLIKQPLPDPITRKQFAPHEAAGA